MKSVFSWKLGSGKKLLCRLLFPLFPEALALPAPLVPQTLKARDTSSFWLALPVRAAMPDFNSNPAFCPVRVTFLIMSISKIARIAPQSTAVFVCDIQEKFRGRIWQFPSVISVAGKMVSLNFHRRVTLYISLCKPKRFSNRLKLLELWICPSMSLNNTLKVS